MIHKRTFNLGNESILEYWINEKGEFCLFIEGSHKSSVKIPKHILTGITRQLQMLVKEDFK